MRTTQRPAACPAARVSRVWQGQGSIEFALVCLFGFLPMVLGVIEIGRGVWLYHQLSQLSREGARYLIVTPIHHTYHQPGNRPRPDDPYVVASCACSNAAVGWIGATATGLDQSQLTVEISQLTGPPPPTSAPYPPLRGADVELVVSYPYRPLASAFLGIPAAIPLSARTVMQLE